MQDTCLPQNYVNCIGKVKVCGCRRFRESVLYGQCLILFQSLSSAFLFSPCQAFLLFSTGSLVTYLPFRLLHSVILSSVVVLSGIVRLSSALIFLALLLFLYYNVRARVCVWRCCKFCKFASFALPFFRLFFVFPSAVFRMGSFPFFRPYTRVRIL